MAKNSLKIPIIDFKKYKGKQLAIVNGQIAASGKTAKEVFHQAKKRFPQKADKEILLVSIPRERVFIYCYVEI